MQKVPFCPNRKYPKVQVECPNSHTTFGAINTHTEVSFCWLKYKCSITAPLLTYPEIQCISRWLLLPLLSIVLNTIQYLTVNAECEQQRRIKHLGQQRVLIPPLL